MNEQIEKIINELNELKNLITNRRGCEWYLNVLNKDSYIKQTAGTMPIIPEPIKPSKKQCSVREPNHDLKSKAIGGAIVYIILGFIVFLLFLAYLKSKSDIGKSFSMIGLGIFGFTFVAMLFQLDDHVLSYLKEFKEQEESYIVELRNTAYYNDVEYPKLLSKYEDEIKQYDINKQKAIEEFKLKEENAYKEWDEKENKAREELSIINEKISNYSNLLEKKYYDSISEIIRILRNGKAQSIKEAISVLEENKRIERIRQQEEERRQNEKEMLLLQRKAAGAARCSSCRNRFDCRKSAKGNENALNCWNYE